MTDSKGVGEQKPAKHVVIIVERSCHKLEILQTVAEKPVIIIIIIIIIIIVLIVVKFTAFLQQFSEPQKEG